jgi:hypothetical protein
MDLDYDLQVHERADGQWNILPPRRRTPTATTATLDEALQKCAALAPHGYVRVRQKSGKVGVIQLDFLGKV